MASVTDLYALIDALYPDTGAVITAAKIRSGFYAMITANSGAASLQLTAMDGATSLTSAQLIGKAVSAIVGDGFTKTSGFSQPNGSGAINLTDGSSLSAGVVLVFFS